MKKICFILGLFFMITSLNSQNSSKTMINEETQNINLDYNCNYNVILYTNIALTIVIEVWYLCKTNLSKTAHSNVVHIFHSPVALSQNYLKGDK